MGSLSERHKCIILGIMITLLIGINAFTCGLSFAVLRLSIG